MALIARSSLRAPTLASRQRTVARPSRIVYVRSTAGKSLDSAVAEALKVADEECNAKGVKSKDCEVAWDQAEELLAAKSHKKEQEKALDPLEEFCQSNEDADECRMHDN